VSGDPRLNIFLDLAPQWAPADGQFDRHNDLATVGDLGAIGHAQFNNVATEFGVDDRSEQIRDLFYRGRDPHGRHVVMVSVMHGMTSPKNAGNV
jgi:hypothetical protein